MKDLRCPKCRRLLLRYKNQGYLLLEIKCSKCKNLFVTEEK